MRELILYLFMFIITYLFYFIFVLKRDNVLKKFPNGKEISYLKYRYGIKVNESNLKSISNKVFLANSFILSTTVYIVSLFDNLLMELILGIITCLVLILLLYHLIGVYYKRKQK